MSRLTPGGTAEPVSRDQVLRRERGQGNIHFPCSADDKQDWQPYPVDPYSCYMCDHTYIHYYSKVTRQHYLHVNGGSLTVGAQSVGNNEFYDQVLGGDTYH